MRAYTHAHRYIMFYLTDSQSMLRASQSSRYATKHHQLVAGCCPLQ